MARFSKVERRMWIDEKFRALSRPPPNAQTLWTYLLTGPHNGPIPGLFAAGEAALAEALEWPLHATDWTPERYREAFGEGSPKGFRECFAELSGKGMAKADWRSRLVFLPNGPRHNHPESPNVVTGWGRAYDELPECALKIEALPVLRSVVMEMGKGFREAFRKAFPKTSANQEQEQEQEQGGPRAQARATDPAPEDEDPEERERRVREAHQRANAAPPPTIDATKLWNAMAAASAGAVAATDQVAGESERNLVASARASSLTPQRMGRLGAWAAAHPDELARLVRHRNPITPRDLLGFEGERFRQLVDLAKHEFAAVRRAS